MYWVVLQQMKHMKQMKQMNVNSIKYRNTEQYTDSEQRNISKMCSLPNMP